MSSVRYLGEGKDEHGFRGQVLEDEQTKARFFAYSLEEFEERRRYFQTLGSDRRRERYEVVAQEPPRKPVSAD